MSDLLSSPRFDRPPVPSNPGWLKSVLGTKLFEAPLAVAMLAATLNCSYAPPAKAALDVRTHLTAPDAGWLTALPLYNAYAGVPAAQDARLRSYMPERRARLDLATHLTAPQNTPLQAALGLWNGYSSVPISDLQRNASYLVPAAPALRLGIHDTAPAPAWIFANLPVVVIPTYPPGSDQLRGEETTLCGPKFLLGIYDTAPSQAWIYAAVPVVTAPTYPPGADQIRNSYLLPARAAFDPRFLTDPDDGWLSAPLRIGNAALAVPVDDAGRNSYAPPSRPILDVRAFLTAPAFSWQAAPLRIGTAVFAVAPDDASRNSYAVASRAAFDVRATGPNFVPSVLPSPAPTYPPGADLLRSYFVAPRTGFDSRLLTAPEPAWIYKALPIVVVPTYPPGADAVRSYLVASRRPGLRQGLDETVPDFSWLQVPLGLSNPIPPVPPPQRGLSQFPMPPKVVVPAGVRRPPFVPRGLQTVNVPPSLKRPWRKR